MANWLNNTSSFIKTNKTYFKAFFIYLLISLIMFWQITSSITTKISNGAGDAYQSLWNLWWVPYSIFILHQSPYFTNLLYYPIGANLIPQTMTPLAGIFTWPIQLVNKTFAYNFLFFTSFALSGLFMFMLAEHLVKNRHAAFIAGLIYAFSPMHIAQSYSHLQWTLIEWIPLYILLLFLTIREKKIIYPILAAASFVLLTFMGDIQQGIILFFFTIVAFVLMLLIPSQRRELLHKDTLLRIGVIAVLILVFGSPFFIFILPNLNNAVIGLTQQASGIVGNMEWSDNFLSFFLPSYYNGIFHGASLSYAQQIYSLYLNGVAYEFNLTERTSYIGYSVLALVALGMVYGLRKMKGSSVFWIIILILFFLIALGPIIQFYNSTTGIPGPYLLYANLPFLNLVREPGRFDIIVTVALAMLAALGFSHISETKEKKRSFNYMLLFSILILIEYNGMPLSSTFANTLSMPATIPTAYKELGQIPGNFSVLILPALPNLNSSTPELYPGMSMYFQTDLHKPIIGGYATRANDSQQQSVSYIPLTVTALYLQYGQGPIYPSPIITNVTNTTLLWLAEDHIAYITAIRNAFSLQAQEYLYGYLTSVLGPPVYQSNSTFVFTTSNAIQAHAGRSIVAYPVGTWIPGFSYCTSIYCDQNLATMWFGSNVRVISVYSPNMGVVNMRMQALSATGPAPITIFLNNNIVKTLNLTNRTSSYNATLFLQQGFNYVAFYERNTTIYQQNPNLNFGIRNITFSKR